MSQLVGKTAQQSEALYQQHSLYLNLASQLIQKEAFMGMVKGYQEHSLQASNHLHPIYVFTLVPKKLYTHIFSLACTIAAPDTAC